MLKVAITGGIGSGKSTISHHFKKHGYAVHDSDSVVSDLYEKKKKFFLDLIYSCGVKNIIKNNKIDKKLIAEKIFVNKKLKIKLEKYIHKEVRLKRENFIKKNLKLKKEVIFLDIPLLLENKLEKQFEVVLCILSNKKNRIKRAMKNKKFSKDVLTKIIKNQTNDRQRRLRSDIIIHNNKTKKDLIFAADKALKGILE